MKNVEDFYPLSPLQQGMWFHTERDRKSAAYFEQLTCKLQGSLDVAAFCQAWQQVVDHHAALRTTFVGGSTKEPVQIVHRKVTLPIEQQDWRDTPIDQRDTKRAKFLEADRLCGFRLDAPPLMRLCVIRLEDDIYELVWSHHHLLHDGWSIPLILKDVFSCYEALRQNSSIRLTKTRAYRDFIVWLRRQSMDAAETHWRKALQGFEAPAPLAFGCRLDAPSTASQPHQHLVRELSSETTELLQRMSRSNAVTVSTIVQGAWAVLLSRYAGTDDVTFGVTSSGRPATLQGADAIVGLFINTLPCRVRVNPSAELIPWLRDLQSAQTRSLDFEQTPLAEIQAWSDVPNDRPLFESHFVFENYPLDEQLLQRIGDLSVSDIHLAEQANYPLSIVASPGKTLRLRAIYDRDRFSDAAIDRLLQHLEVLLQSMADRPGSQLAALEILTSDEKRTLGAAGSSTLESTNSDCCIHDLFARIAIAHADRIAVASETQSLTYAQLDRRSNQLARYLQARGVGPDVTVAMFVERTTDMIVGALATLKAGGAYVPLDPAYPKERLAFMLKDCGAPVVLTETSMQRELPDHKTSVVLLDEVAATVDRESSLPLKPSSTADNLAYVIYTSGSTGTPKGCLVTHRNVVRLFDATQEWYRFDHEDVWTMFHSFAFDFSVWEIWGALLYGGRLVLVPYLVSRSPDQFLRLLEDEQVTVLNQTPSAFQQVITAELGNSKPSSFALRYVTFGGEALDMPKLLPWFERFGDKTPQLINMYGITETTVHVTYRPVPAPDVKSVASLIGQPLPDLQTRLLDLSGNLVPLGIPGEIHVGGAGVARGYLGRPSLTAERFVPDPFAERNGQRLYRSGDLARQSSDGGETEYMGRIDKQVKLRGFRIELGEIEARLTDHPAVREAVVDLRQDDGDQRLVAYLVADPKNAFPVQRVLQLEKEGSLEGLSRYELPNGMTIVHKNKGETDFVYQEVFEQGTYSHPAIHFPEGAIVFDVGANIGLFSLYVNTRCANPTIYAFEPIPEIFALLKSNAAIYGLNAKLFEYGISNEPGEDTFTYYPNVSVMSGRYGDQQQETDVVKAFLANQQNNDVAPELLDELLSAKLESQQILCQYRTISQIIDEEGIDRIDVLKIDVEQSEFEAILGIEKNHWSRIQQVVIEVHDQEDRLRMIAALLRDRGFDVIVEQEDDLQHTNLYSVYGVRPSNPSLNGSATRRNGHTKTPLGRSWSSPSRLIHDVREDIRGVLPEYMVPSSFVLLDALPLTPNGKLDRRALPNPDATSGRHRDDDNVVPRSLTEAKLVAIWQDVLGVRDFGVHESFFDLGGHSLHATRVIARVRDELRVDMPLAAVFDTPTISGLAAQVDEYEKAGIDESQLLEKVLDDGPMPLSPGQNRLWVLDQLGTSASAYVISAGFDLTGDVNIEALSDSFSQVIDRHEVLRTVFRFSVDRPVQIVQSASDWSLSITDLKDVADDLRADEIAKGLEQVTCPFDLATGPLLRARLLSLSDHHHVLLVAMHHIVSDGWSVEILVREVTECYRARVQKSPLQLPELPIQYADYAVWQRSRADSDALHDQLEFWKSQLGGQTQPLELPTDRPRPAVQSTRGQTLSFDLSTDVSRKLRRVSRQCGATNAMTLLAAFQAFLHRYSGQSDISVGMPVANRRQGQVQPLIGFFVNTIVIRALFEDDLEFASLLTQVRRLVVAAVDHQELPFESIVTALVPNRNTSRSPLFQAMFVMQDTRDLAVELPGLTIQRREISHASAKFDLTLFVEEETSRFRCALEFNTDLFDVATARRMSQHFTTLLDALVSEPGQHISQLPLLTAAQRRELLEIGSGSQTSLDNSPFHRLFEQQVKATPDAVAAVYEGSYLTFQGLNQRANQLARYLKTMGVGPEVLVGIAVERSLDLLTSTLAVLKAGGAYVPLDPSYPAQRLEYMMSDANVAVLLTNSLPGEQLPTSAVKIRLDRDWPKIVGEHTELSTQSNLRETPLGDQLAYVIYTSGSTGQPKGTLLSHRGLTNYLHWCLQAYPLKKGHGSLVHSPLAFDATITALFAPLLAGRSVQLAPEQIDIGALADLMRQEGPFSVLKITPAHLDVLGAQLTQDEFPNIAHAFVIGGENLATQQTVAWQRHAPRTRMFNEYGPTEAVVGCVVHEVAANASDRASVPIGKVIPNASVYALDPHGQIVPDGVLGELNIGGVGLARGYLNRADLTADRFVPDAFGRAAGGRVYRTGDVVRFLNDHNLEFVRRIDDQTKIRGHRIELGEIEAVLGQHDGIREVVVVDRELNNSDRRLVAYYVARAESLSVNELRRFLQSRLPEYMIPAVFVPLESIPLTKNGKVDRARLPQLDGQRPLLESTQELPRNEVERRLAEIWQAVLGLEQIGIHDNFFELGGDSILCIQVISKAREAGLGLTPQQFFQHPTVAEQSAICESAPVVTAQQGIVSGESTLTPIQRWFFAQNPTQNHHWNQSVRVETKSPLDAKCLEAAVEQVVHHHDALRSRFAKRDGAWHQTILDTVGSRSYTCLDLAHVSAPDEFIQAAVSQLQSSLSLDQGPVIRFVHFRLDGQQDQLLIVAHHLVVDGISWRVLLEDLETAYAGMQRGLAVRLPHKTASLPAWSSRVAEYEKSEQFSQQSEFWCRQSGGGLPIPVDVAGGANTELSSRSIHVALSPEETAALLRQAPRTYRTEINDLLLTALGMTLRSWTKSPTITVNLESHGREAPFEELDISRTVGWFTSLYPVTLVLPAHDGARDCIMTVKEQLRRIPMHGFDYGMLANPSDPSSVHESLAQLGDVSFNYLGQTDQLFAQSAIFQSAISLGDTQRSPSHSRSHVLDIVGIVQDGKLSFEWIYSEALHQESTIREKASEFVSNLRQLTEHCLTSPQTHTPSDFAEFGWTQETLDELDRDLVLHNFDFDAIYPLTPIQQGIWFHALADTSSAIYFEQLTCTIRGNLDHQAFADAWQSAADHHAILRTAFFGEDLSQPVQGVVRSSRIPISHRDLRGRSAEDQADAKRGLLESDRALGFNLSEPPLIRITLLRVDDDRYEMIWSYHHLLVDGWSVALLLKEVVESYDRSMNNVAPRAASSITSDYRDFVVWLHDTETDRNAAAESYWRSMLDGFDERTPLPLEKTHRGLVDEESRFGSTEVRLSAMTTATVADFAKSQGTTLSTLVQSAWGFLLSRYARTSDVVFGVTVSGRPTSLPGADAMIGLFINTLPLRLQVAPAATVKEWLKYVQSLQADFLQHQHTSLSQIQKWSEVHDSSLFDSIVVFENYAVDDGLMDRVNSIQVDDLQHFGRSNYPLSIVAIPGNELAFDCLFDRSKFEDDAIQQLLAHLTAILQAMAEEPTRRLGDLSVVTESEQKQLSAQHETRTDYERDQCVHELFQSLACRYPDRVAITSERESITYRELDRRSNQTGHYLRSIGVGPDVPVAICLDRSVDLIVGILGILKAGGAYVPLDANYPRRRLQYMLDDTSAEVLITSQQFHDQFPDHRGSRIDLRADWSAIQKFSTAKVTSGATYDNLAYVMYTSGSTGDPKGTTITHQNVVRLVRKTDFARLTEDEVILHLAPISFDASTLEIWGPLLNGGRMVVFPAATPDLEDLGTTISEEGVTTLWLTAGLFHMMVDERLEDLKGVRQLLAGGDVLSPARVKRAVEVLDGCTLINGYGPTENTTFTCCHPITSPHQVNGAVPIGRPIANTQAFTLDAHMHASPRGVHGELCTSGDGLARGYLNHPQLTAERFVPNPRSSTPGQRMYRTGDIAYAMPDGSFGFVGRRDAQVKVRGFRIELREIERTLDDHPTVTQSVVVVDESEQGAKCLVAYVVGGDESNPPTTTGLRRYLHDRLPDYMHPTHIMVLDRFPLTENGKLDRRALPSPSSSPRPQLDHSPQAPRNEVERTLVEIWTRVLGIENVGIQDNFFELGGDSILSIQVASKARKAGILLKPTAVFQHQTIAQLANFVGEVGHGNQEPVVGDVALSPIQHWFFGQDLTDVNHFNQSLLLEITGECSPQHLRRAVKQLVAHHDMLRARFEHDDNGWRQYVTADAEVPFIELDLSHVNEADQHRALEDSNHQLQKSLNITSGPLLRVAYYRLGKESHRLLLVGHHLIVDGISWRILLEDLDACYQQLKDHTSAPNLGAKTQSFQHWSQQLEAAAHQVPAASANTDDIDICRHLPVDFPRETRANTFAASDSVTTELSTEETESFLRKTSEAYQTGINDLLLTAIAESLCDWSGEERVVIDLEGHGRDVLQDVDLSRTVGWFTSINSVSLHRLNSGSIGDSIKSAKEQLRHGAQRFRNNRHDDKATSSDVLFNYLGQLDQAIPDSGVFTLAKESCGQETHPHSQRSHLLCISACVVDGRMQFRWTYSTNTHRQETIQTLADEFGKGLRQLIEHCVNQRATRHTPSDFPLASIDQKVIDRLEAENEVIDDVYPLSGMQEGMLFRRLYQPESDAYLTQVVSHVENLEIASFRQAWNYVLGQRPLLRTFFVWRRLDQPLQVIKRHVTIPLSVHDLTGLHTDAQDAEIALFLRADRKNSFDFDVPPLMRFNVFQLGDERSVVVWTNHHILLDGWSMPLLMKDVFECYQAITNANAINLPVRQPYRDYIAWLRQQDFRTSTTHWRTTLKGVSQPTRLRPRLSQKIAAAPTSVMKSYAKETLELDIETTERLDGFCRRHKLTQNTLIQGAWALVLDYYSGQSRDVLFGVTVSGRPSELQGVESMLGLFINTLPLRARFSPDESIATWLQSLQLQQRAVGDLDYCPLSEVQACSDIPQSQPLFESIVVFENFPVDSAIKQKEFGDLRFLNVESHIKNDIPFTIRGVPGPQLSLEVLHDTGRYDNEFANQILETLSQVLTGFAGSAETLNELLAIIDNAERTARQQADKGLKAVRERKLGLLRRKPFTRTV